MRPTETHTTSNTTTTDADQAVRAAAAASRTWADSAPEDRAGALNAVADTLEAHREELVTLADAESHLGPARLHGELTRTTFQLRLFADEARAGTYLDVRIDRAEPNWPTGPRPELRRYRAALGPVLVFAASNFPFAFSVAGGDTTSAWAAGCPVVLKAHPGHPELSRRTAALVHDALTHAGAPAGVFTLLEDEQAGTDALRHPQLKAAAFTGSQRGGLTLARVAAERPEPIPFYGELGSSNPIVVTPGAAGRRGSEIAQGYAASLTQGAGQFCTNPGLLFVPAGHGLEDAIADCLRQVPAAPMLNARIADGYLAGARQLAERTGARTPVWPDDDSAPAPRLLGMELPAFAACGQAAAEECFGPLGLVVTYQDATELPAVLETLPGQLTTSLHAEEDEAERLTPLAEALAGRSGRVLFNGWPTGVSVTHAMQHGGPYPATTAPTSTSVGTAAIERFLRPVTYQAWPEQLLPAPLRDDNPWQVPQQVHAGT